MTPKNIIIALLSALLLPPAAALAQQTGVITGRVFNTATGEYIRSAEIRLGDTNTIVYSEDGGYYRMQDVPAGPATLTASYASLHPFTAAVTVPAGGAVTLDFELQALLYGGGAPSAVAAGENVVMLDKFTVSETREGQAKAIMEQRAAINAKSIIASDNFGELTMGDVGEFMKYMPGVAIHYEVDAHDVRIGGLDPKYTNFSQDGVGIAPSTGGRNVSLLQMSITGIEAIEFNQTLTASMDAGSAAGIINLKSKNAFARKHPLLQFQLGMNGSGDSVEIRRSWLPDDRRYFKTLPGMQIGYARAFFNRRLGVEFNASYNGLYSQQDNNMAQYTYPSPDAQAAGSAAPTLTSIGWRDGQQITHRLAGNLSVDYKLTDHLVLSLRGSYSRYESEFFNYYTYLRSRAGDVSSDPGYTSVTAIVNGTYSRLDNENSHRHTYRPNWVAAPSLVYKNGPLTLALRGGHSNSRSESRDGEKGFFRRADSRLTRIGWTASRPDSSSPEWVITQTAGADWSVPENWGARDDYLNNVRSEPTKAESSLYSGNFDATYAKRLLGLPFLFKAGLAARSTDYAYAARSDRYTYVGETGLQKNTVIPYTKNYASSYDLDGREGNVNSLGWRTNNTNALWDIFQARPDWFVPDTVGNFTRALTYPRALDERVDAAYFELNTKVQRLRLNAGARYERTSTDVDTLYVRSEQEVADAGYDPATVEGVLYRYHDGRRFRRDNKYDDLFLSGGAKYDITQNLQAQLSASQSILRPDYDNLAGIMVFEDEERRVWVPNQNLKPERITKYFASLQRQLTPAGLLGVSAYRMDIRDRQTKRVQISREQAELQTGIDLSGNDSDTQYLSATNAAGQRSIYGLTLEYNQQLTFLPGMFKGLGLFGSFTRTLWHGMRDDTERIGYMPKSANGGIRYRYGRLNLLVRATWQDGRLMGITEPVNGASTYLDDHAYMKERTMIDVSGGFRINKHLSFVFSVRNILNAPQIQYSNTPGRMMSYAVYSSFWNCGVKGTF